MRTQVKENHRYSFTVNKRCDNSGADLGLWVGGWHFCGKNSGNIKNVNPNSKNQLKTRINF